MHEEVPQECTSLYSLSLDVTGVSQAALIPMMFFPSLSVLSYIIFICKLWLQKYTIDVASEEV